MQNLILPANRVFMADIRAGSTGQAVSVRLGDGQVDFKSIFSKLAAYDYKGWAVLEWECCIKHPEDGAKEGAVFIKDHIIRVTEKAFDDFAGTGSDENFNRSVLGLK